MRFSPLSWRALPARPPKELAARHVVAAIEPTSRSSHCLIQIKETIYPELVTKATTLAQEAIPMRIEKAYEDRLWPLDRQQRYPVAMERERRHDALLCTLHV